jgi:hypothetical protein
MDPSPHRHPADRRLEERTAVDGLELTWGIARRHVWPRRTATARALNISRGGLLALVPNTRGLRPGVEVPIVMCGGSGLVRVRHIRPSARRGWRMCGLDIIDADEQLRDSLERIVGDPSGRYAEAWSAVR